MNSIILYELSSFFRSPRGQRYQQNFRETTYNFLLCFIKCFSYGRSKNALYGIYYCQDDEDETKKKKNQKKPTNNNYEDYISECVLVRGAYGISVLRFSYCLYEPPTIKYHYFHLSVSAVRDHQRVCMNDSDDRCCNSCDGVKNENKKHIQHSAGRTCVRFHAKYNCYVNANLHFVCNCNPRPFDSNWKHLEGQCAFYSASNKEEEKKDVHFGSIMHRVMSSFW